MKRIIVVDLTNVSKEEQNELKKYLEEKSWSWKEKLVSENQYERIKKA